MKYKVNVEELLSRIVEVEAENEEEAEEKVRDRRLFLFFIWNRPPR